MNRTSRPAVAVAALALSTSPLLLAAPAAAETTGNKSAIEYAERQAAGVDPTNKAQIERAEREQTGTDQGSTDQGGTQQLPSPQSPTSGGDNGAAAWQLALSAAFGAALTGGVVVASRQLSQHRHAVAS